MVGENPKQALLISLSVAVVVCSGVLLVQIPHSDRVVTIKQSVFKVLEKFGNGWKFTVVHHSDGG